MLVLRYSIFLLALAWLAGPTQTFGQTFESFQAGSAQPQLSGPLEWASEPSSAAPSLPEAFVARPTLGAFQAYSEKTVLPTQAGQDAWLRFTLAPTQSPQVWLLRIPRLTIDTISLYSPQPDGSWKLQSAGTRIAPNNWPLRTRNPTFEVQTTQQPRTFYLHFQDQRPISERPMMLSAQDYIVGASMVGASTGLAVGLFGLLAVMCLAAGLLARSALFLWLGVLVVASLFTQLVLTGHASWRLWPDSAYANSAMPWVASMLTLAIGAWFFAQASFSRDSHPWVFRLQCFFALGSLVIAGYAAVFHANLSYQLLNGWAGFALLATSLSLAWMWFRGQVWSGWLILVCLGLAAPAAMRVGYNLGFFGYMEVAQAVGGFVTQLTLMALFLALLWRSRAALFLAKRGNLVMSFEPATGLVLPHLLQERLPQFLLRSRRLKRGSGVLMLRWLDADKLRGPLQATARASVLRRLGEILRRISREIDTAARFDDENFVLLVEGPVTRDKLALLASQLLAACLRSSEDGQYPDAFGLHVAIWQGESSQASAEEVMTFLTTRLNFMSRGKQRPVQFVDAQKMALEIDSEPTPEDARQALLDKINALEAMLNEPGKPRRADLPTQPAPLR